MALNDMDKAWVREAIREGNKPNVEKLIKDWFPAAAVVALLIFAWNKSSDFTAFTVKTNDRLEQIEKTLARQNLTSTATLSTGAFASNLPQLAVDIKTAREKQITVSAGVIKDLSQKLLETSSGEHGYWLAAVQFVDFKYLPRQGSGSLPKCQTLSSTPLPPQEEIRNFDGSITKIPGQPFPPANWVAKAELLNCVLDLDDNGDWASTSVGRQFQEVKKANPNVSRYVLDLTNVLIKYSGGKLPPVDEIRFTNCWFELPTPADTPNKETQRITTQLLEAERYQGKVNLQSGI
jgi:hypothetical protein